MKSMRCAGVTPISARAWTISSPTHELILLPCAPVARLEAGADHSQTRPRLLRYTSPFSLAGVPTVAIPVRRGGMQLAAARGCDEPLLGLAAQIGAHRKALRVDVIFLESGLRLRRTFPSGTAPASSIRRAASPASAPCPRRRPAPVCRRPTVPRPLRRA